jgi:hypothetical protein
MTIADYKSWPTISLTTRLLFNNIIMSFRKSYGSTKSINMLTHRQTALECINSLVMDKNRVLLINDSHLRNDDNVPVIRILLHKGSKILQPLKLRRFINGGVRLLSYGRGLIITTNNGLPIYSISFQFSESKQKKKTQILFQREYLQMATLKPYLDHYKTVMKIKPQNLRKAVEKQTEDSYVVRETVIKTKVLASGKQRSEVNFPALRDSGIFHRDQQAKYLTSLPFDKFRRPMTARVMFEKNTRQVIVYNRKVVYVTPTALATIDRYAFYLELLNLNLISSGNYKPIHYS